MLAFVLEFLLRYVFLHYYRQIAQWFGTLILLMLECLPFLGLFLFFRDNKNQEP